LSGTESSAERKTDQLPTLSLFGPEELTTEIYLDGRLLHLNTDWRDIRRIIKILSDESLPSWLRTEACIRIFIDNYEDIADGQKVLAALYSFIDCGEKPSDTKGLPKVMDWDVDFQSIISDMNKVAKCEDIRSVPYMHWFTFISIFHAIGEGNLSYAVNIRKKLRNHEKHSKEEAEWVSRNKEKAYLKQQEENYDEEDEEWLEDLRKAQGQRRG